MRKVVSCFFFGVFFGLIIGILAASSVAIDLQPGADYHARREALARKAGGAVVLFAPLEGSDEVYEFRQENNFFYLSGQAEPGAALLIAPAAEAKGDSPARAYTEILFLPPHNLRREKFTGPKLGAENPDAPKITGFDRVEEMSKLPEEVSKAISGGRPIVYADVPAQGGPSTASEPLAFLKHSNAVISFQDVKPMVASLRMYKDAGEVALLRKAVDASAAAHFAAFQAVKPSVNEREISALMQYEWIRRGCERPSYAPIVGSGLNSTVLHYSEDTNVMNGGDVVVIDAAGEYSMYAADITRTLPVNGHFTARQREIYDIVLGAQEAAMSAFQSGKSMLVGDSDASIAKVAKDYIDSHGKDLHGDPLGKYFIHGLGHYIGLKVHDDGDYKVPLGPGMAFTIEPGIYIPEEKIGVRIEDDYWVDPSGKLVKLSAALPSKADDVEKAMKGK
ncbi:MAG TPA: aminopeptidase P N-terminal domain-containing protein [Candidatus Sulfotelmatobacter sp.]|nr:aminopeptidase P N-terminal domain-containing protein [Candidatus Sulfotelmatobacter sp.]